MQDQAPEGLPPDSTGTRGSDEGGPGAGGQGRQPAEPGPTGARTPDDAGRGSTPGAGDGTAGGPDPTATLPGLQQPDAGSATASAPGAGSLASERAAPAADSAAPTGVVAVAGATGGGRPRVVTNPDVPPDMVPPKEGTDRVGSIPAVSGRRAWVRSQLANWRLYLVRMVSAGLSVILAVVLVPGLSFVSWSWGQGLAIAVIFALINAFVKPVLQFLSLRFLFSSYGIVIVLINTLLLLLLDWIMDEAISATGLFPILLGGALIGVIGTAIDAMLGADYPALDRDYKERNGLA